MCLGSQPVGGAGDTACDTAEHSVACNRRSDPKRLSGEAVWLKHRTLAVHRFTIVAGLHGHLQPQPARQPYISTQPCLPRPVEMLDAKPLQRLVRVQSVRRSAAVTRPRRGAEPTTQRLCQRGGQPRRARR
jgi:hypothetical protein